VPAEVWKSKSRLLNSKDKINNKLYEILDSPDNYAQFGEKVNDI